jgi:hypothetical protein
MSIDPAEPIPVSPIKLTVPDAATASTCVTPPSTMAVSAVTVMALAVALVVNNPPRVMSPALVPVAVNAIVPPPAFHNAPSVMVMRSPVSPLEVLLLAVTLNAADPDIVMSPLASVVMLSSAVKVTLPADVIPALRRMSELVPVAVRLVVLSVTSAPDTVSVPAVDAVKVPRAVDAARVKAEVTLVIETFALLPPAVCVVTETAPVNELA